MRPMTWTGWVLLVGAAGGALLLGGCPGGAPAASNPLPVATLGLASVTSAAQVRYTQRHYHVGCVPAAFTVDRGDEGRQFFVRVATAAQYGECFVARPRMDWTRFGPNGDGQLNVDIVNAVDIARANGVQMVAIEIDPVADRRHVGVLPPELAGKTFADAEVREPLKRMAVEMALRLHPTYLSIGVEMNAYYEANPADFEHYITLHKETYDLIKSIAPEIQFIAAFNLEALQGFYGDTDEFSDHPPQWFLFDRLEPQLDAVAFATLPFGFYLTPLQLPDDYLSRIAQYTKRDILFTEIGWPGNSADSIYTPQSQVEYISEMARQIDRMPQARLVVWTTLFDGDPGTAGFVTESFQHLGLFDYMNQPKPALNIWKQLVDLPYRP